MLSVAHWISVPEVRLPGGLRVPAFRVGRYLCGRDTGGNAVISATSPPWVHLDYFEAVEACRAIGTRLISERQCLAIAHDICMQKINWSGGEIGAGQVYQGLHKESVLSAQAATYVSDDPEERRWHQLSNGEIIVDFAGNASSWVFDDVQGDRLGLKAGPLAMDSPSLTTPPFPSLQKGMGWRPSPGRDWSMDALFRGGCWNDGQHAGIFFLGVVAPDYRNRAIGFRCVESSNRAPRHRDNVNDQ